MADPTTEPTIPPVDASATGGGFHGGEWFQPEPADAPGTGAEEDGGLFADLLGDGQPVTEAKAVAWLQGLTETLDDAHGSGNPNGRVKADLRLTDREAKLIAAGLVDWSQRTQLVALAVDPPPAWKAAAGLGMYGWRVRGEHLFAVEMEQAAAAQGAAQLHQIQPFDGTGDHPGDVA